MKRLIAALALVLTPLFAAPAAAGPEDYLGELEKKGFNIDGELGLKAYTVGLGACVDLFNGVDRDEVITNIAKAAEVEFEVAEIVVNTAQKHLCPKTKIQGTHV